MNVMNKFNNQNVHPTREMIVKELGRNVNLNNVYGSINNLCSDGYMYENDGQFIINN